MNTLLADPPAASGAEQAAAPGSPPAPPEGSPKSAPPAQPSAHTCSNCGVPLQEGQQWCLHCGACEPGSLGERSNWRPLAVLALAAVLLAAGAVVAGAAALNRRHTTTAPATTVALTPVAPTTATPTATTPTPTTPVTPGASTPTPGAGTPAGTPKTGKGGLLFPPAAAAKPPKLPSPTATPKSSPSPGGSSESSGSGSGSSAPPAEGKTTETGSSTTESGSKEGAGSGEKPNPIQLDTDAATTYNPSNYPASGFGDPALAIDGEPTTAWTAQVQASSFPNMAEGLLIDLRSPTKLGSIELATPTHGMAVQIYGANTAKVPTAITEPGWTQLKASRVLKKKVTTLKLRTEGKAFHWVLVWVIKAPAAAQGTPQAPGHVGLSEVALYPPAA